jgi:hypothetical protein
MVFNSGRRRARKDAARSNWTLERELAKCDEAQKWVPWVSSPRCNFERDFLRLSKKAILADAEVTAGTAKYGADSKQMANLKHTKANTETARDAKEDEYVAALGQLPVLHPEVCEKVKIAIEKLRALEIKRLEFVKVEDKHLASINCIF